MKPRLIKDYFSVPKGTIVRVVMRGTDAYNIINEVTGLVFAIMTEAQKKEYIK